jgi:Arc/MetJ family transcription regulator
VNRSLTRKKPAKTTLDIRFDNEIITNAMKALNMNLKLKKRTFCLEFKNGLKSLPHVLGIDNSQ